MVSFLSIDEMRKLAEGVKHNIDNNLNAAFDPENHKETTAQNRISTAIICRTDTVLKELNLL